MDNLKYIGFDEFLMKSFEKFLRYIGSKDYTIVFKEDRNKSDLWVLLLLIRSRSRKRLRFRSRDGRKFLKRLYKGPKEIIELKRDTPKSALSDDKIYMFCDDFIYCARARLACVPPLRKCRI